MIILLVIQVFKRSFDCNRCPVLLQQISLEVVDSKLNLNRLDLQAFSESSILQRAFIFIALLQSILVTSLSNKTCQHSNIHTNSFITGRSKHARYHLPVKSNNHLHTLAHHGQSSNFGVQSLAQGHVDMQTRGAEDKKTNILISG